MNWNARAFTLLSSPLFAFTLTTALVGCASTQAPSAADFAEEVEYHFARAEHAFDNKDYPRARSLYQQIAKDFPYSQYASLSDLRVADAYYAEKVYSAAAEAYRAFVRLRPRHEKIPYAEFRVVDCFSRLMPRERFFAPPTHERDLTDALVAYREGRRYLVRYRDGEFTEQTREIVQSVADRLAAHELYVAAYYRRRDNFLGAMRRAQYVVANFPESTRVAEAYWVQADNAFHAEEYQVVRDVLAQIANAYPDSSEMAKIEALVGQIPAPSEPSDDGAATGAGTSDFGMGGESGVPRLELSQ